MRNLSEAVPLFIIHPKEATLTNNPRLDCWLSLSERITLINLLLCAGLIKFDNGRTLPLKSGGKTDIYVNLRDLRTHPRLLKTVAGMYGNALRRLGVNGFAEIPDAVSCLAGVISVETDLPYITIRAEPKPGRVSDATIIGRANRGEHIALLDDVITDGASKIGPYKEMKKRGLKPSLLVLVDRMQGWRKTFADIDLQVWYGMTLHDIRKYLVSNGIMERCSPELEVKNPIIVALDDLTWEDALPILDALRPSGCILKGNDLINQYGFEIIPHLEVYGRLMVDVKVNDIGNTLENVAKKLRAYRPWAVTVHTNAGEEGVRRFCNALKGSGILVLGITVLTSIDEADCKKIYNGRTPLEEVLVLASIGASAGVDGLVCSPHEVSALRAQYPNLVLVTPGTRSPGVSTDDQKRVATPRGTKDAGSDYLVMGRQILGAPDPVTEVERVLTEELGITL